MPVPRVEPGRDAMICRNRHEQADHLGVRTYLPSRSGYTMMCDTPLSIRPPSRVSSSSVTAPSSSWSGRRAGTSHVITHTLYCISYNLHFLLIFHLWANNINMRVMRVIWPILPSKSAKFRVRIRRTWTCDPVELTIFPSPGQGCRAEPRSCPNYPTPPASPTPPITGGEKATATGSRPEILQAQSDVRPLLRSS